LEYKTEKWLNLPNCLTILRILLIPVFLAAYFLLPGRMYVSFLIFVLASFTDVLDGYLARHMNRITSFGKLLDPLADKLMVLAVLFCLAGDGELAPVGYAHLNWLYTACMLIKELFMLAGSFFMLKKGIVVQAGIWGKAATLLFTVGIVFVFPWHASGRIKRAGLFMIPAAVILSLTAMVNYIMESVKKLSGLKTS